ncbi:MAG: hypothetical protein LBT67_01395, partial [Holosporaceae bacterium]|nr:hypothetical protein [Holosporaceae bacterium]
EDLQKVLESEDISIIKGASEKLLSVMSKAGEVINKAAAEAAPSQPSGGTKDDDVVDADFTEKEGGQ